MEESNEKLKRKKVLDFDTMAKKKGLNTNQLIGLFFLLIGLLVANSNSPLAIGSFIFGIYLLARG